MDHPVAVEAMWIFHAHILSVECRWGKGSAAYGGVLNFLGVPEEEQVTEAQMNEIAAQLANILGA